MPTLLLTCALVAVALLTACDSSGVDLNDGTTTGLDAAVNDAASIADAGPRDLASPGPVDLASLDLAGPGSGDVTQRPPTTGRADIEAWLALGHYKAWACEPAPHAARPPGAHGMNRICSNAALSTSDGPANYPVGAATVKELYDGAGTARGYAVMVRALPGGGAANWYWYERIGASTVADGLGDAPSPAAVCTGCHAGAPRDQIYTQVR